MRGYKEILLEIIDIIIYGDGFIYSILKFQSVTDLEEQEWRMLPSLKEFNEIIFSYSN